MSAGTVTELTSTEEFKKALADNALVAIDFFADWCGPCKMISPKYVAFAKEYTNVKFFKVNVDEATEISEECGISAMPTFHFYKNGTLFKEFKGASEEKLKENLDALCA